MNHDAHHGVFQPSRVITREGCFRYGRLQFADVGGNSADTLAVPVEAQYWDGQRFVTNTANSVPPFAITNEADSTVCRQSVWPDTRGRST